VLSNKSWRISKKIIFTINANATSGLGCKPQYTMMNLKLSLFLRFFVCVSMAKRSNDYLSAQFHKERRAALRTKLPQNSVALFLAIHSESSQ
jgi:hypothetical protein